MPKTPKLFKFNSELYTRFKDLVSKSPYTITGVFEKFMSSCVEDGVLSFPSSAAAGDVEAEARVMLAWLKKGKHWYSPESGEDEFSVRQAVAVVATDARSSVERYHRGKPQSSLKLYSTSLGRFSLCFSESSAHLAGMFASDGYHLISWGFS